MISRSNVFVLALASLALAPWSGVQGSGRSSGRPTCNAGASQIVESTGPLTLVFLDGTGSSSSRGDISYKWEICNNPRVSIDDITSATPTVFVDMVGTCEVVCNAFLIVKNGSGQTSCSTSFTVHDTTAPEITCPPDVTVGPDDPTDPSATGSATATDVGNPSPTITHSDVAVQGGIERTWVADDGCQTSSCIQTITIEEPPHEGFHIDIKPGSCPNPINVRGDDEALGDSAIGDSTVTVGFLGNSIDATQVNLSSLAFGRPADTFLGGATITPKHTDFADNGTPFLGELCGCHALTGDGTTDVTIQFSKQEMIDVFLLLDEPDGTYVQLELTGEMLDGTPFSARDCVRIINHD